MSQKLTKFEYEYQKESIEQDIRGLDISILEVKRDIKSNQLEAATWDLETSKESIRKAKLGYESARTSNDISEQKLEQLNDQLSYERAMTFTVSVVTGVSGNYLMSIPSAIAGLSISSYLVAKVPSKKETEQLNQARIIQLETKLNERTIEVRRKSTQVRRKAHSA